MLPTPARVHTIPIRSAFFRVEQASDQLRRRARSACVGMTNGHGTSVFGIYATRRESPLYFGAVDDASGHFCLSLCNTAGHPVFSNAAPAKNDKARANRVSARFSSRGEVARLYTVMEILGSAGSVFIVLLR